MKKEYQIKCSQGHVTIGDRNIVRCTTCGEKANFDWEINSHYVYDVDDFTKTGKALQWAIDHYECIEGMEEYLDAHFAYLNFDLDYGSTPTWEEALQGELFEPAYWMLEGSIDHYINGTMDYDVESLYCEYEPSMYCGYEQGEVVEIRGEEYKFITTLPCSAEMEHQAENGKCAYDYRGCGQHIRIYEKLAGA